MAPTNTGRSTAGKRPSPRKSSSNTSSLEQVTGGIGNVQQNGAVGDTAVQQGLQNDQEKLEPADAFESNDGEDTNETPRASVDLEDLPIELIGLTDSFIESLSAKVHPAPANIDNVSRLFQDFYAQAAAHISTHIAALATRQTREHPRPPSAGPRASAASLLRAKAASIGSKDKPKTPPAKPDVEHQMITAEELAERKRARRQLEQKRGLYEEAVERRLCEGMYGKIYRHRSTQDEAQDDKLRSKTAALAVVGIGPLDLGVELWAPTDSTEEALERQEEVRKWLEPARRELMEMNNSRYPLGKLNRLKAAHKSIVDTLSHFHPSSSADEIMPMLIYSLITLPPDHLSVVSDVNFVQRFRWEQKLEGEAAYCLTNLEAAISFLDNVDLSTLRADEPQAGPPKNTSSPGSPKTETFPPAYQPGITPAAQSTAETNASIASGLKPTTSPAGIRAAVQLRNRRLSDLVNTPAQAFGAASDAVLSSADQGLKNIGNSLGDSYKFFLGKLRERLDAPTAETIVPKTLDDARKLISTPPPQAFDDEGSVSGASSVHTPDEHHTGSGTREERMLSLISGKKASRDHSADSSRSSVTSGSRKVAFAGEEPAKRDGGTPAPGATNPALIDSVRNLGNSFNPISRFSGGMNMIRGFGRTASTPVAPTVKDTASTAASKGSADGGDLASAFPDIAAALPPKPQIAPPNKRFMELQNPADLRLGEVLELLRDYRRLAGALKDMDAFKER
ncbi:uncharacterized protein E0L32_011580 [Thyridium curvatum]|uniref:VPS9 domain-containing protein n=1 Tax=Thyridium curvatum TaxID=1093900 RepID=A0A507B886_9PEZI|nr:uncharacterized protein E0L32_011580 [Thyridium curvatum]TPX18542.1 hypothetical protein E0L32_011580 [Thyridium curvatum]